MRRLLALDEEWKIRRWNELLYARNEAGAAMKAAEKVFGQLSEALDRDIPQAVLEDRQRRRETMQRQP